MGRYFEDEDDENYAPSCEPDPYSDAADAPVVQRPTWEQVRDAWAKPKQGQVMDDAA
jgi:hypothetical protein